MMHLQAKKEGKILKKEVKTMRIKKFRMLENENKLREEALENVSGGRKFAPSGFVRVSDKTSEEPSLNVAERLSAWRYW